MANEEHGPTERQCGYAAQPIYWQVCLWALEGWWVNQNQYPTMTTLLETSLEIRFKSFLQIYSFLGVMLHTGVFGEIWSFLFAGPLCRSSQSLSGSMGTLVESHFQVSGGMFTWVKSGLWLGQICCLDQRNLFLQSESPLGSFHIFLQDNWSLGCYSYLLPWLHSHSKPKRPKSDFFFIFKKNSMSTKLIKSDLFKADLINLTVWFKFKTVLWDICLNSNAFPS